MAIALTKFGQSVMITVRNVGGGIVYQTNDLRIDFDIRLIKGFSRAKFTIYNLASETVKKLANGDNYVSITTQLHDGPIYTLANNMYLSNAIDEKVVPNRITNLYCYSLLRKLYFEKRVDVPIQRPSLRSVVSQLTETVGLSGAVQYKFFPPEVLDYTNSVKPARREQASLETCLQRLAHEFSFNYYTSGADLVLMYKPDANNVSDTDLFTSGSEIELLTDNMRSNPKIGPAQLSFASNLDPRIRPATVVDASKLIAIEANADEVALQLSKDFVSTFAGFSKYQVLSVQHKGSNFANLWHTEAVASSPVRGSIMATENWAV